MTGFRKLTGSERNWIESVRRRGLLQRVEGQKWEREDRFALIIEGVAEERLFDCVTNRDGVVEWYEVLR
jgi:hypothetical protein